MSAEVLLGGVANAVSSLNAPGESFSSDAPPIPGHEEKVPVRALHNRLRLQIERRRSYRELPCYVVFLGVVTAVPWMSRLSSSRYNELYHLEQANRVELQIGAFEAIHTRNEFWVWLKDMVEHVWEPLQGGNASRLTQHANLPIGHILLRQFRVRTHDCAHPGVLSARTLSRIPQYCNPEWDDGQQSTAPYGPNGTWVSNAMLERPINLEATSTAFHDYSDPSLAFPVLFPLHETVAQMRAHLAELEQGEWVDSATRVVIIDVLTFNPSIEAFSLNHLYVEFFATGSIVPGMHAYPFELMHLDNGGRHLALFCDMVIAIATGYIGVQTVLSLRRRKLLGYTAPFLGLWDIYDIPFVLVHLNYCIRRLWLWTHGPELHDPGSFDASRDELTMFATLFGYGLHYEAANTAMGIAVVFAWLRLFRYMQFHSRLGVMSATVRRARGDLFSLLAICVVLVLGFGISGAALYGVDHQSFSSWQAASGYLLRLIVSGEVNEHYAEMVRIQPTLTWIWVTVFLLATWMLLLNMVLAVLNGAFLTVLENRKRTDGLQRSDSAPAGLKGLRQLGAQLLAALRRDVSAACRSSGYCGDRLLAMHFLQEQVEERRRKQQEEAEQDNEQSLVLKAAVAAVDAAGAIARDLVEKKMDNSTTVTARDWANGCGYLLPRGDLIELFARAQCEAGGGEADARLEQQGREIRRDIRRLAALIRGARELTERLPLALAAWQLWGRGRSPNLRPPAAVPASGAARPSGPQRRAGTRGSPPAA
eukprot:TRINITY_DN13476_c0_g1_i1.p1 TRINITY_DN13476_c0_g1~~TRINITY_DN13476_c0_g1_i1.p1  ORF type:complete len:786 (+),score=260.53 TRINITY_DN13476_c0_g1_i1:74-2359(+)